MEINATLVGQLFTYFVLGFAIAMTSLFYYLGKRKTQSPSITAAIGFFTAFVPPVALIFLFVLVLRPDLDTTGNANDA